MPEKIQQGIEELNPERFCGSQKEDMPEKIQQGIEELNPERFCGSQKEDERLGLSGLNSSMPCSIFSGLCFLPAGSLLRCVYSFTLLLQYSISSFPVSLFAIIIYYAFFFLLSFQTLFLSLTLLPSLGIFPAPFPVSAFPSPLFPAPCKKDFICKKTA